MAGDYISREAVIKLIVRNYECPDICTADINRIPASAVEPVVHCGECQGWEPGKRVLHKCDLCRMFGFGPGDYCSLGHGKDGAE